MKIVCACLLALTVVGCNAQSQRASTAFSLYNACFRGTLTGGLNSNTYPRTTQEIDDALLELDEICIGWTAVWYPAFKVDANPDISKFTKKEVDQFNKLRYNLVGQMKSVFMEKQEAKK